MEKRILFNQGLAGRLIEWNVMNIKGTGCLRDRTGWYRTAQKCSIRRAIGQLIHRTTLRCVQGGDIIPRHAMLAENGLDEHLKSSTCRSCDHSLSFQIRNGLNSRIGSSDKQSDVGRHGCDGANIILLGPTSFATSGKVGDRSIGHTKL